MQDEKWLNARGLALQNIRVRGGRSFGIAALSLYLFIGLILGFFGAFLGVVFGTAVLIFAVLLFAGLFSPLSALLALRKTEREGYGSLL